MKSTSLSFAAIVAAILSSQANAADMPVKAPPPPPLIPFFIVNDNSLTYRYVFNATNPGAGETPKHVVSFSHFDVWAYGTNFVNVDWLKATNNKAPPFGTPAAPCDAVDPPGTQRCDGYTEIYALTRNTFGFNQIFNTKAFSWGPLTNIELALGADVNTDNTTLGSAKRSIQAGLQFDFSAPYKGFLNVAFYAYKEWQNDGFASTFPFQVVPNPSGNVSFDVTWAIEALYVQPLGFLPSWLPVTFKSLLVVHGDKGCGEPCNPLGPGLVRTTEYLTAQTLSLDVGQMIWGKEKMLAVFAQYIYWKNKFGIDPDQPTGPFPFTTESTLALGATVAF
jgi:nucleoside-specific outer membrane channel protein Tsx